MNMRRAILLILTVLSVSLARAADWYVNYRNGLDAVHSQKWSEAISYFNDAISERPDEKAKARTVGVQFIDYFPYVYRGLAYAKSGNAEKALADFEHSEREKEVFDGSNDKDAQRILREYLGRLRAAPIGEKAFMDGRDLFRQREFTKAIEKFRTVPANSAYRREAQQYIDLAQAEMNKDRPAVADKTPDKVPPSASSTRVEQEFQAGVRLFDRKDYAGAEIKFRSVLEKSPDHAGAQRYLNLCKSMKAGMVSAPRRGAGARTDQQASGSPDAKKGENDALFSQAMQLFGEGKLESSRRLFLTVRSTDPTHAEAAAYLDSIARTQEVIRGGVLAFFEGDYRSAIHQLGNASRVNADNVSLYGILAAAYASQYFLGGGEERDLQKSAVESFRRARQIDANYRLDGRYFSPRIVAFFNNQ
jgi:tetratricopeptide (TPR) repeat protein